MPTPDAPTGRSESQSVRGPAGARGYLHGFTPREQERLYHQARFMEQRVHEGLPFQRSRRMLEVGCGVGAQTEILLRRFPDLHVTGVDASRVNLDRAVEHLAGQPWTAGRFDHSLQDAGDLDYEADSFDSAFLCWVLEHVSSPGRVLSEVRRVLRPGASVALTEVQNMSFFVDPYAPNAMTYWLAFNDRQLELGGDPFVGAKLGNLLLAGGFREIRTEVRNIHLDNRQPAERAEFLDFWTDLLLSGAPSLLEAGLVSQAVVDGMERELRDVAHDPNAVFFFSFVRATARVF